MTKKATADSFRERNEAMRIEIIDKVSAKIAPALRAFFRRLGYAHVYQELMVPSLANGAGLIVAAVRDRPWPPWGIDAQHIHALAHVHPVSDTGASLSGVFVAEDDLLNIGLAAAVYKETLETLRRKKVKDVSYLVREGTFAADKVLVASGFEKTDDLFLTEQARYNVYRSTADGHLKRLGLDKVKVPDLLSHTIDDGLLGRFGLLRGITDWGTRPFWRDRGGIPGIIPNTGGGLDASQPGGVDSSPS